MTSCCYSMVVLNTLCLYISIFFAKYSQYRDAVKHIAAIMASSDRNGIFYRSGEILRIVINIFVRDGLYRC